MKIKLLKGFLPLAAAFLLGSCSDDKFGSDSSSGKQISFRLQGNLPSSRATGTTKDNINAFVVNAQAYGDKDDDNDGKKDILPADAGLLFTSQTVARLEGQANAFDYSPKRYYPDAAAVAYYSAYSPVTKNVKQGFNTDLDQYPDNKNTIAYFVPAPDIDGNTTQEDLLVAYTPVIGKAVTSGAAPSSRDGFDTPVSLNFRHALSRVFVRASNTNVEPVVITGLSLHNLYSTGTLEIDGTSYNDGIPSGHPLGDVSINEGYKTGITPDGDPAATYKVLWSPDLVEPKVNYPYVLLPTGVSVPAGTEGSPVVGKDQGMLVLPQTTVNTNNDAEIKGAEVSTDFYVEVTYRLSNIQRTVRAAFTDINKLAQGLTFEMGRQYALTLAFSDTEIKFDISVEPWDADEQLANAATTVVFDANKPAEATEDVEHIHDANSGFIYGQSLPALYYESSLDNTPPSLTKWYFLGYFDSPEGGTQYYKADLNSVEGVTWNKAGPSSTLYAHWTDHLFGRSNIYFQPDLSADLTGNIGSLTFSEDDASKFGYQGLYFKWGSLIGVAAGNNSSYDSTDTGTYLYIPALGTGKYYKVRAGLVSVNYTDGNSEKQKAVQAYANSTANKDGRWTDIPFVDGGNDLDDIPDLGESTAIERAEHRLTERSTDADLFKYYKGDICKFLSDKKGSNGSGLTRTWVMPKSEVWKGEYHGLPYTDLSGWSYTWKDGSLTNTTPDGTDISGVYLIYTTVSKEEVNFPAAGYRSGGTLNSVGFYGGYWSSSVGSASLAFDLYFSSDYVIPDDNSAYRAGGFPVRCVQEF